MWLMSIKRLIFSYSFDLLLLLQHQTVTGRRWKERWDCEKKNGEKNMSERLKPFFFQRSDGSSLWRVGFRIRILLQLKKKKNRKEVAAPPLIEKNTLHMGQSFTSYDFANCKWDCSTQADWNGAHQKHRIIQLFDMVLPSLPVGKALSETVQTMHYCTV